MKDRMAAPAPFFIVGFQRSGTTLLRLMLDSHPDVAIPLDTAGLWARYAETVEGEFNGLRSSGDVRRITEALLDEDRIRLWQVDLSADAIVEDAAGRGYAGVVDGFHRGYARAKGKRSWGSKDPGDMKRIDLIHSWFPDAKFVHIVRDGRDACLSQIRQDFGHNEILACAAAWREEVWWVRRMGGLLGPRRYHEVRYEDLVRQPRSVLERLCHFLDMEFDPAMLDYHQRVDDAVPDEKRHIWPLIDRPPQTSNVERWRSHMSQGLRVCFEKRAGALLYDLDYAVLEGPPRGAYTTEIVEMLRRVWRVLGRRLGR